MRSPLERLWKDRMDIYRWEEVVVNKVTKSKEELQHSNVKCHYSQGSLTDTGEEVPTLKNSHMLFCSADTDILEGDKVIVTQRNGKKVTLTVGEGFAYFSNMQFSVKRDDTA
ncbi:MAG TPA: hypothetical protein DC000_13345 [Clostridiales bacterium]|nr:hypothetical protein [Clostridiales bacterium]